MAKNVLSWHWSDTDVQKVIVTGSQRQPTIVEAINFLNRERFAETTFIVAVQFDGMYIPPEEVKSLALVPIDSERCPVCGHEHDLYQDHCPVCLKKWVDE